MQTRTKTLVFLTACFTLALPALALAGGAEGGSAHGASLKHHGYYLINFVVFLGLLYMLAGDKIKAALRDRSRAVGAEITAAGDALTVAKGREDEAKAAFEDMPSRTEEIQKTFAAEGAHLAETIQARTATERSKIEAAARVTAEAERTAMQRTLTRELAELTLDEAERLIAAKQSTMNHDRLFSGFVAGLDATRGVGDNP